MTNHPNRSNIKNWPEFLREFRLVNLLSQAELADNLQISKRAVEAWEQGINIPPPYLKGALEEMKRRLDASGGDKKQPI